MEREKPLLVLLAVTYRKQRSLALFVDEQTDGHV